MEVSVALRSINFRLQLLLVFALIALQDLEAENLTQNTATTFQCTVIDNVSNADIPVKLDYYFFKNT